VEARRSPNGEAIVVVEYMALKRANASYKSVQHYMTGLKGGTLFVPINCVLEEVEYLHNLLLANHSNMDVNNLRSMIQTVPIATGTFLFSCLAPRK